MISKRLKISCFFYKKLQKYIDLLSYMYYNIIRRWGNGEKKEEEKRNRNQRFNTASNSPSKLNDSYNKSNTCT